MGVGEGVGVGVGVGEGVGVGAGTPAIAVILIPVITSSALPGVAPRVISPVPTVVAFCNCSRVNVIVCANALLEFVGSVHILTPCSQFGAGFCSMRICEEPATLSLPEYSILI